MNQKYHPINCHFYDELELLAVRQQKCEIIFHTTSDKIESITDTIVDFKIINQAEYMVLEGGNKIRLDYLISVDGKKMEGYSC